MKKKHAPRIILEPTKQTLERLVKELSAIKFALEVSSVVTITQKTGEILYVNDKFCELTKYSRKDIIGKTHHVLNSDYHPSEFFKDLWTTILKGMVWSGEIRDRAKDGRVFWVDTTIVPLMDDNNTPSQFICIRNEITKRKEMEEAFKMLPRRIIHAQEKERDRISREIHDDLGQSLATLKLQIQSTLLQSFAQECQGRPTEALKDVLTYLDKIIMKSRNLASRLRPSSLEVLGLTAALKHLIAEFRCHKDLKIYASISPIDSVYFWGDAINLYRVIQEALTNVIMHAQARKVAVRIRLGKDQLHLVVADDGVGFNMYEKQYDRNLSHGLGLSTMDERIKMLHGRFNVETLPGNGTKIRISIPVSEGKKNNEWLPCCSRRRS